MRLCSLFGLIMVAGCAPTLAGGNEAGGVIRNANDGNVGRTFEVAEAACERYGKAAKGVKLNWALSTTRYDCVAK